MLFSIPSLYPIISWNLTFSQIIELLSQNFISGKLELHYVYILYTLDSKRLTYLGDTSPS